MHLATNDLVVLVCQDDDLARRMGGDLADMIDRIDEIAVAGDVAIPSGQLIAQSDRNIS